MQKQSLVKNILKYMISEYFQMFQTSFKAMHHLIFSTSTRTEWVKDDSGYFVLKAYALIQQDDHSIKEVDVETLPINKIPKFEEHNVHFDPSKNEDMLTPCHIANLSFQNLVIDWANNNLDAISDINFHFYGQELNRFRFINIDQYSAILTMPDDVESIHPEWADTISTHLGNVLTRIRTEVNDIRDKDQFLSFLYGCHHDMYPTAKKSFEVLEKLNQRAVSLKRRSIAQKIIQEILDEEKINK